MASFSSYQHLPFHLIDSVFLQNFPSKMPGFSEEPNNTTTFPTHCFSQFINYQSGEQRSVDISSHLEQSNTKISLNNKECVTNIINDNKQSTDSSSLVLDKVESGEQVTQKVVPMDNKRKFKDGSSFNSSLSKNTRDQLGRNKKPKKSNGGMKKKEEEEEKKKKVESEVEEKLEAPMGYIHVRARRGQATDSHSLAERVRREKISERMKLLQALVPGCDKVTGKALLLDEIINYVQSLQNQVEFLSMKLASLNPLFYDFGMDLDGFIVKPEANMQHGSQNQSTGTLTNTFTTPNNYNPLLENSTSLVFQQAQIPNILPQLHHFQSNGQMLWDVDQQRHKFINQCGLFNNNFLASFH